VAVPETSAAAAVAAVLPVAPPLGMLTPDAPVVLVVLELLLSAAISLSISVS